MSFITYGDLATTFHTRHMNARMRQDLVQLGQELTTGRKANLASAVSADFGPISGIEHSLTLLSAHEQSTNEATVLLTSTQVALEHVQSQLQDLSAGLIGATSAQNATLVATTAVDAREKFGSIVAALNTSAAGRSLFAGAAADGRAVANADQILTSLMAAIAGETTAAGVAARIDDWFDDAGGGFETSGYAGSDNHLGPFRLGNGETVSLPVKADDGEIRDVLRAVAKSAVIAEGALSGDLEEQKNLVGRSSSDSLTAIDRITYVRANVGAIESRVANASAQNAAEKAALELARNDLTAADPFETATALEALYGQMESLYTVTSRLSKLTFRGYMR